MNREKDEKNNVQGRSLGQMKQFIVEKLLVVRGERGSYFGGEVIVSAYEVILRN